MNIKRFQTISKIISIILRFTAVVMLMLIILGVFFNILYDMNIDFASVYNATLVQFSQYTVNDATYNNVVNMSVQIVGVLEITALSYVYWKGGQLFKKLSIGEKPFTSKFAKSVKIISLILILSDLISPLLVSLIVTLQLDSGYLFMIDFTSMLFFGLILYVISGIFYYGLELQTLANETV